MPRGDVERVSLVSVRVNAGFGGFGEVEPAVVELVFHMGGGGGQPECEAVCGRKVNRFGLRPG